MVLNCLDRPLKLYGLNHIDASAGDFWRLPKEILDKMPRYENLGRRCVGGRDRCLSRCGYRLCLFRPRNEHLAFLEIETEPGASVEAADDYTIKKPIVFYGSSITEGGCAPRPGGAYTSILSRWLDADHYNYGFSGNAKGEPSPPCHCPLASRF